MIVKDNYVREAEVLEWTDGDTLRVRIDQGYSNFCVQSIRVWGLNCPESRSSDMAERERGKNAAAFARTLIPVGSFVMIKSIKTKRGVDAKTLGRYLGVVTMMDGRDYARVCIEAGHGTYRQTAEMTTMEDV